VAAAGTRATFEISGRCGGGRRSARCRCSSAPGAGGAGDWDEVIECNEVTECNSRSAASFNDNTRHSPPPPDVVLPPLLSLTSFPLGESPPSPTFTSTSAAPESTSQISLHTHENNGDPRAAEPHKKVRGVATRCRINACGA